MAIEFRHRRGVHPIYLLGLAVFVVRRYSPPIIGPTHAWVSFAHWVFGMVT